MLGGLAWFPHLPGVAPGPVGGSQPGELLLGDVHELVGVVEHPAEGGQGVGVALLLPSPVRILVVRLQGLGVGVSAGVVVPGGEGLTAVP